MVLKVKKRKKKKQYFHKRTGNTINLRRCCNCKDVKRIELFPKEKGKPLGRMYFCLECNRERNNKRYKKNKQEGKTGELRIRFEIFYRDNFTCQYCGKRSPNVSLEIDHIIPKSKGGDNKKDNLITSCWECNRGKGDILLEKYNN